jgi:hypothetical protein
MMGENVGANKYERYVVKVVNRDQINEAYYNPRQITDEARKQLKDFISDIKRGGLLDPLSWNEKTGNLLGGHQRIKILDQLHRGKPYQLTVAACDMDETDEVRGNIFLNNASAQGTWDIEKLKAIKDEFEVDFLDCGFSTEDLDVMGFADIIPFDTFQEPPAGMSEEQKQKIREDKQKIRDDAKSHNVNGDGLASKSDFSVTIVFDDNLKKRDFMERIGFPPTETRLPGELMVRMIK